MKRGKETTLVSPILTEYFNQLYPHCKVNTLAKAIGSYADIIKKVINGTAMPNYELAIKMIEYAGDNKEKLYKLAKMDDRILYKYWDELYPDAAPKIYLGSILRDTINEMHLKRQYIEDEILNVTQSYLSTIENQKNILSYSHLVRFCDYIGETPRKFIMRLVDYKDKVEIRERFSKIIIKARKERGWTQSEAAKNCYITLKKYQNIENGQYVTVDIIKDMCSAYGLEYSEMFKVAVEGNILTRICKSTTPKKKASPATKFSNLSNLETFLIKMLNYVYITDGDTKIESHTLITIVLLRLLKQDRDEKEYNELMLYYLEHVEDKGNIYLKFFPYDRCKDDTLPLNEIYKLCMKKYRTFSELSQMTGFAKGNICNYVNNGISSLKLADKLFSCVNLNDAVGLEKYLESKKPEVQTSSITLDEIIKQIGMSYQWKFWNKLLSSDTVKSLISIIVLKERPENKLNMLNKLDIPDSYKSPDI